MLQHLNSICLWCLNVLWWRKRCLSFLKYHFFTSKPCNKLPQTLPHLDSGFRHSQMDFWFIRWKHFSQKKKFAWSPLSILPLKKCKNCIFSCILPMITWNSSSKWEYASNVVRLGAEFVFLETKLNMTHVLISGGWWVG